jgi:hypothetical protein
MSKLGAAIAGLLAMSVIGVAVYLWLSLGSVDMGVAGWLSLIGGGLATFGLGAGLMALLFYSNRAGFDERAGGIVPRSKDEPPPGVEKPPQTR